MNGLNRPCRPQPRANRPWSFSGLDNEHLIPRQKLEKRYGQSLVFIDSALLHNRGIARNASSCSLLKEAIHVVSCGYEDKTEWGKEVSRCTAMDGGMFTAFRRGQHLKVHPHINLSDRLHQVSRWALGSVEMVFSKHCPIWYGYGCVLKPLE